MKEILLDSYEKEILDSFDRDEFTPIKDKKAELAKLRQYARATMQKNKRINIRLSERDLIGLQTKALEEGLPYQTLISSVLHKYVRGALAEKHA
ncbi:MAG: antitoxin [Kiritimatiellae bacterium]|nr:antitoxin [Kiritimatiellia bacterium]